MNDLWNQMGHIHWPLLFSFLAVVGLSLWSAMRVYGPGATANLRTKAWIDAVLFWGGFALIAGVLGTLVGFIIAAQSIEQMGGVELHLLFGGMKIALSCTAAGALILAVAALAWFALQLRWRLLLASEESGAA